MENNKYLVNVIFHQPFFSEEVGQIQLLVKSTSFEYQEEKDALLAYEQLNLKKFIEFDTMVGKITFSILSVELLNLDEHEKVKAENQEQENNEVKEDEI